MSFYQEWERAAQLDPLPGILALGPDDVERALSRLAGSGRRELADFAALISPAAEDYLLPMSELSQKLTRQRFGNTISMYLPLYLANHCANDCSYCGFSAKNKIKRKVLSANEVDLECRHIAAMGFKSLLLVTGEHERMSGMAYFREVLPVIKPYVSYLMMEVQPLSADDYRELVGLGLDGVMVYQETYDRTLYERHHLHGRKKDFRWRLETPDRLGEAGVDKIGLGALLGLGDWRTDSLMVARHLRYLRSRYWKSRYSLSFPRLRPCAGDFQPQSPVTDRQLLQLICAYRLFDPEVELSISTREGPAFRDFLMKVGITTMSAGSSTQPGGYASGGRELEQFAISDERSAEQVAAVIRRQGMEVVWQDASAQHWPQSSAPG
ncbi:2-iminoacetate synthase ThiH [Paludibacterium yongneupense]|uniref:2-iminoacetate synthase ThiH n=1 Tax=Paludibacterium yongneupense TaxID=400061 RepID=UPI000418BDBF|nr:2-iminoacetate synthase ThiH [Paludibacterium yongneupense]